MVRIGSPTCLRQKLVHYQALSFGHRAYVLTDSIRPLAGIPIVSSDLSSEPLQRDQWRDPPHITPKVIGSSNIHIVFIHTRATERPGLDINEKEKYFNKQGEVGRTFIVHELEYVRWGGRIGDPSESLRPVHIARGCGSDNAYIVGK